MKHIAIAISTAVLFLFAAGCAMQSATVTSPTSAVSAPSDVTLTLDAIEITCAAAVPEVSSPTAAAWLAQCPPVVTATANSLAASSPGAVASAITSGLTQFLKSAPIGVPAKDLQLIQSIAAAVTQFLQIYQQQVAEVSHLHVRFVSAFAPFRRWAPSSADKRQLKKTKKAAADLAKKLKAKH